VEVAFSYYLGRWAPAFAGATIVVCYKLNTHSCFAHVLRLHSREPASRDPVYRGDQFTAERLEQHRNGEGSSFVKAYGVYRLVYVESYERPEEAIAREKQLKRWKRDWKIELIERENLEWRDLSDLLV
jgi:putative endonuclease